MRIHCVEEEPLPYLVMEYIEGETLQQRLDRDGPLEPEEAVRIGRQIALGLAAAHAAGLVHRDIKPSNIMLEKGSPPVVKITDFGIARTTDDASLTASNVIVGTPMYMSPEQANGAAVDARSDLFSLGSVLYTMVSGRPPFRALQSMAVLKCIVDDRPRSVRVVNPAVGGGLAAVIDRLHAKRPEDRYATATEAAQALEGCLRENPGRTSRMRSKTLWGTAIAVSVLIAASVGIDRSMRTEGSAALSAKDVRPLLPLATPKIEPPISGAPQAVGWENAVAEMHAVDQALAVNARLQLLNPKYDGTGLTYTIKNGAVDTLSLDSADLADLAPLHALKKLRELTITTPNDPRRPFQGVLSDLSPLRGMNLEVFSSFNGSIHDLAPLSDLPLKSLTVWGFMGRDLTPLHGMQLTSLNLGLSKVSDLAPLRGVPLEYLCLNITEVSDLSPLEGMKLKTLLIEHTNVTDLGPAWDMPLEVLALQHALVPDLSRVAKFSLKEFYLDYDPARDLELLRSIKTLEQVNHMPLAVFLAKGGQ